MKIESLGHKANDISFTKRRMALSLQVAYWELQTIRSKCEKSRHNLQSRLEIILPLETWSFQSRWKPKKMACLSFSSQVQKMSPRKKRWSRAFEVRRRGQEAFRGDFFCPGASLTWSLPLPGDPLELLSPSFKHPSLNNLRNPFLGNMRNYM